jgi:hypothetical protein
VVLLIWTDGTVHIPLGIRRWPKGGPSQEAFAWALLSDARHRLRWCPASGLCDAWYPAQALRKRLRDAGWDSVCRLQKHRRCHGQPRRAYRRHPSWAEPGRLTGGGERFGRQRRRPVLCHPPPDTVGPGGAAAVSGTRAHRRSHPGVHRSTRVAWLSSALRAGAEASRHQLCGRLLRAGAGTT